MKILTFMLMAAALVTACNKTDLSNPQSQSNLSTGTVSDGSANGRASARDVYYDAKLFTVNMKELSDDAAEQIIANNTSFNIIYAYNDLDEEQPFNSVIDAVPADGMNPLWLQMLIVFNQRYTPHQFYSDDEVLNAVTAGEITLVNSGEIYRCSVIGPK
jgi:hypothetical protein